MARFALPTRTSKFLALALLVTSVFVALVVNVGLQDSGATPVAVPRHAIGVAKAASDSMSFIQEAAQIDHDSTDDPMSMMQEAAQLVDASTHEACLPSSTCAKDDTGSLMQTVPQIIPALSVNENELEPSAKDTAASVQSTPQAKPAKDTVALVQSAPQAKPVERASTYEKELETLAEDTAATHAWAEPLPQAKPSYLAIASSIGDKLASTLRLKDHLGVNAGPMVIAVIVLCAVLVCLISSVLLRTRTREQQGTGPSPKDIEQWERTLLHTSPASGSANFQRGLSGASLGPTPRGAFHSNIDPRAFQTQSPALSGPSLSGFLPDCRQMNPSSGPPSHPLSGHSITDLQRSSCRPPPLCPTLVMPMSEALLGIQMYELAQLSQEGSLNIVGVSGKPLLRAEVKKVGIQRTLEISIAEANSIPRATVAPPTSAATQQLHGSRALEIRGMRGAFYGILQMQSSGACYVVKDGQTVLTVDGDAESLQLSIKSSVGMQLASVKCSTEQFEGVDHVEIHVEPGMDTVLVSSVVLAILLLSPYLPDDE